MEGEDTLNLNFYPSKVKNAFLSLIGLAFMAFGALVGVVAFKEGDYFISSLGAFLALSFAIMIFFGVKRLWGNKPMLILTEAVLIVNASSKKPIPILWDDIIGYNVIRRNSNTFIDIELHDEYKYLARISNTASMLNRVNEIMDITLFSIAYGQVRRKDRRKLVHELDRLISSDLVLTEQIYPLMNTDDKEQKAGSRVNLKHILQSYGYSLILTALASLLLYLDKPLSDNDIPFLVASFIFYPFAKVIYDELIGFKLTEKVKKQSFLVIYIYRLRVIIHMLLYLFSFFIGPFGILYLILSDLYKFLKRRLSRQ